MNDNQQLILSGSVGHQNARQGKKSRDNYLHLIKQFTLLLQQFNQSKKYHTINPYRRFTSKIELPFSDERKSIYYLNLFDSLVHQLTLFNQLYRVERKNKTLESSKEDVVLALELLSPLVFPSCFLSPKTLAFYQLVEDHFEGQSFTVRQVVIKIRKSKSTVKRQLKLLEEANYIQRTGGDKKKGYVYSFPESN